MTKTLLIVDDHPVVLFGLRFLFDGQSDIEICGEASDAISAIELAKKLKPDYIVLDLVLGGKDGLELLHTLNTISSHSRTLIYSSQSARSMSHRCRLAGAWGYVSKSEGLPIVATAITKIAAGSTYFVDTEEVRVAPFAPHGFAIDQLSTRELQIVRMLGEGMATREMADKLGVSTKTVSTYRERIKLKLSLANSRQLDDFARDYVGGRVA